MKPTALGGNIFAGLFTQGVKEAGYQVLGHLEHGLYGVETARRNFPGLEVRVGRQAWQEKDYKGKVDLFYTNPPCAAWSGAGKVSAKIKGSWEEQTERLRCVMDLVEAGLVIQPRAAFIWESVTNAWTTGQIFVREQAERWNDAGYHVTILLQDNQYLGVPQVRKRMFFIAHRHPLVWPALTEPITVREAFATLKGKKLKDPGLTMPYLSPMWKRLWKLSANHNNHLYHALQAEGRGGLEGPTPSVMTRRLDLDQPAPVMLGADKRFHPTEPRPVGWYELLTLVGLPLTWQPPAGSFVTASQELSRAVMPAAGRWVALAVKAGMKLPRLNPKKPVTKVVDLRKPDEPSEHVVFEFAGLTIKPTVLPPPPPPKPVRPGRAPRATSAGPRKPGSGARIREMLLEGKTPDEILKVIHAEFPGSRATRSDVSWNKGRLRRDGLLEGVPIAKTTRKVIDDAFEGMKLKHENAIGRLKNGTKHPQPTRSTTAQVKAIIDIKPEKPTGKFIKQVPPPFKVKLSDGLAKKLNQRKT